MYQSKYDLETFNLEFSKRCDTVSEIRSTSGKDSSVKISITASSKDLKGEFCTICISTLQLTSGEVVSLSLLLSSECGYENPIKSDVFGERIGTVDLKAILPLLPKIYTDKITAKTYLARNPEMLVSLLSNTLNTQLSIIQKQDKVISDLDWWVSAMYKESGVKVKKTFNNILARISNSGMMSELKKDFKRRINNAIINDISNRLKR